MRLSFFLVASLFAVGYAAPTTLDKSAVASVHDVRSASGALTPYSTAGEPDEQHSDTVETPEHEGHGGKGHDEQHSDTVHSGNDEQHSDTVDTHEGHSNEA